MGVRIDDIAKAAGVSTATVSRVLNSPDRVSPETRGRVEAAIKQFNYKPNLFARGLMRATTNTVGILVPFFTNPYHVSIVDSIEKNLAQRDIRIYLCNTYDRRDQEERYLDELGRRNVDALILVETASVNAPQNQEVVLPLDVPVILVNEHLRSDSPHHIIRCAQEPGFLEALDRLIDTARLPIDLVIGDLSWSFDLKERIFLEHLERRGIKARDHAVVRLSSVNMEDVVQRCARYAREALGRNRPPRAFLAGNDLMGVGLLQGVISAGFRVPQDVAVIGVDNSLPSRIAVPPLSTVDLREADVGRLVAETYFDLCDGKIRDVPVHRTIDSQFVNRGTA